jgi:hypothetical protein
VSPSPSPPVPPGPTTSPSVSAGSPQPTPLTGTTNQPATGATKPTPTGAISPTPASDTSILRVRTFLKETGPVDGVSYALLIIWSFIAGFAERLVPDTLNRLVAKNEAIQGK